MWPWAAALMGGAVMLAGLGLWVESSVLAPKPTYQQRGVARAPALQVAKAVPELLPAQFSVCATVRADCPPATETCGDLLLLGGTAAMEGGCGALYVFWRQAEGQGGTVGFGVQCNGGDSEDGSENDDRDDGGAE